MAARRANDRVWMLDENEIDPEAFFSEHVPANVQEVWNEVAGCNVLQRVLALTRGQEFVGRLRGEGAIVFRFRCITRARAEAVRNLKPRC
jgi:hypothetical protein